MAVGMLVGGRLGALVQAGNQQMEKVSAKVAEGRQTRIVCCLAFCISANDAWLISLSK